MPDSVRFHIFQAGKESGESYFRAGGKIVFLYLKGGMHVRVGLAKTDTDLKLILTDMACPVNLKLSFTFTFFLLPPPSPPISISREEEDSLDS